MPSKISTRRFVLSETSCSCTDNTTNHYSPWTAPVFSIVWAGKTFAPTSTPLSDVRAKFSPKRGRKTPAAGIDNRLMAVSVSPQRKNNGHAREQRRGEEERSV